MPPPRRLRQATSMVGLEAIPNGSMSTNHSHSTLNLHDDQIDATNEEVSSKLKRKKWYSMFMPPHKEKVKAEVIESESSSVKKEKKKKWYKSKKKEKFAVQL